MGIFSSIDFGMLQAMLYPVIVAATGVDVQDMVSGKAPAFRAVGEGLSDLAAVFDMAAEALDDGILTNDEINALIAGATDLSGAFDAIRDALDNSDDPE